LRYRHRFHAGSFADVHKHVTLLALLTALQRKDSGFLYLETHAGGGAYDLTRPNTEAMRTADALERLRTQLGNGRAYPGSPLLAAAQLRPQDRAVLFELVPSEARALARALHGFTRARVEEANGFERLRACLPPRERRSLIFIDPPYEERTDFENVAKGCEQALQRLRSAIVAAWYPIKDARTSAAWLARLAQRVDCENLVSEWWLYPRDSRVALNGSGLVILNPPYQFAARMHLWLPELHAQFKSAGAGGWSVRTLASVG
jgi:23S rRNA (adenine2030-N6)-methyltransferase